MTPQTSLWGGQFCPQPPFRRPGPAKSRLRPRLAALQLGFSPNRLSTRPRAGADRRYNARRCSLSHCAVFAFPTRRQPAALVLESFGLAELSTVGETATVRYASDKHPVRCHPQVANVLAIRQIATSASTDSAIMSEVGQTSPESGRYRCVICDAEIEVQAGQTFPSCGGGKDHAPSGAHHLSPPSQT